MIRGLGIPPVRQSHFQRKFSHFLMAILPPLPPQFTRGNYLINWFTEFRYQLTPDAAQNNNPVG